MSSRLQTPMASAPPDPPSPITTEITGTCSAAISSRQTAIASACPRSSASIPGYAPGVSMKAITGRSKRSASFISRSALRYPSGRGMPKLRSRFSLVERPFCWPSTSTGSPSRRASPPTSAASSAKLRSPCSSIQSVKSRCT